MEALVSLMEKEVLVLGDELRRRRETEEKTREERRKMMMMMMGEEMGGSGGNRAEAPKLMERWGLRCGGGPSVHSDGVRKTIEKCVPSTDTG